VVVVELLQVHSYATEARRVIGCFDSFSGTRHCIMACAGIIPTTKGRSKQVKFWKYFGVRLLTWAVTIMIGVTFIFFIPRMFPSDPVEAMIGQMTARSGSMDPVEKEALRTQLRVQFGLEGSLWSQYVSFLWNGLLHFDFGPSLMSYPEKVNTIIGRNLPFTVGLSLISTILAWVIGNVIGLLAGFRPNKKSSKFLEAMAICIYPIPYFIVALVLQIIFSFILGWFPLQTTLDYAGGTGAFILSLLKASVLPGVSILLLGTGWWIISMKSHAATTAQEDFVQYARYRGISEKRIGAAYVFRNSILTQVTMLAMSIGGIFNGSIMTEIIFGYPGVGILIQKAITMSDYNMIFGCITISIVAISTCTLIADLLYPLFDPRIRYS